MVQTNSQFPSEMRPQCQAPSESCEVDRFVRQQNLERLRKLSAETPDHAQRPQILKLLEEEEAKDQPPTLVRRPPLG